MYGGRKMKRILIALVCMTLLAGCGNNDNKDNANSNSTTDDVTDTTGDTTNNTDDWYKRFESGLNDQSITYSAKTSLDATTIGGAEGYRYTTENGNIDVYRFEDGDDFNKIMEEKKVNLNGTDTNVEINDHMVIVSDGVSDDVMNIFKNLK